MMKYFVKTLQQICWFPFSRPEVRCVPPMTPVVPSLCAGEDPDSGDQATTAGSLSRSLDNFTDIFMMTLQASTGCFSSQHQFKNSVDLSFQGFKGFLTVF